MSVSDFTFVDGWVHVCEQLPGQEVSHTFEQGIVTYTYHRPAGLGYYEHNEGYIITHLDSGKGFPFPLQGEKHTQLVIKELIRSGADWLLTEHELEPIVKSRVAPTFYSLVERVVNGSIVCALRDLLFEAMDRIEEQCHIDIDVEATTFEVALPVIRIGKWQVSYEQNHIVSVQPVKVGVSK